MNTHTQGPWTLRQHATNHQTLTGATAGLIADIHKDEDARLIAAAPDLLEALIRAEDALHAYSGGEASELERIRAAIDKATVEAA